MAALASDSDLPQTLTDLTLTLTLTGRLSLDWLRLLCSPHAAASTASWSEQARAGAAAPGRCPSRRACLPTSCSSCPSAAGTGQQGCSGGRASSLAAAPAPAWSTISTGSAFLVILKGSSAASATSSACDRCRPLGTCEQPCSCPAEQGATHLGLHAVICIHVWPVHTGQAAVSSSSRGKSAGPRASDTPTCPASWACLLPADRWW